MKKHSSPILVTGATGFIGSWVVARLIKASRHVAALDQNPNASRLKQVLQNEEYASVDFYSCDISNTKDVQKLINKIKPETIIHLAALQIPACRANPVMCGQVNVIGQINIFEAALKFYKRYEFTEIAQNKLPSDFKRCEVDNVFLMSKVKTQVKLLSNKKSILY